MKLKDKVAIVTGAASGIGLATARRFTAEGAKLVAADWNEERLSLAVSELEKAGGTIVGSPGNIADQGDAEGLIDLAIERYGRLDVLINNAGIMDHMEGVGELNIDVWRRVMAVNVDGPMWTMRRAVPVMVAQGSGSIINVASVGGIEGGAAGVAYTTSKHALVGMTRNTAWIYANQGIRCNAICPGGVRTNIAETMPQDELDPAGAGRAGLYASLMPAFLEPEDIAALAVFLASDESNRINGAIIPIDAGWTAA